MSMAWAFVPPFLQSVSLELGLTCVSRTQSWFLATFAKNLTHMYPHVKIWAENGSIAREDFLF